MKKISSFYREFLLILILVILFFSIFGAFNDLIVQNLSHSTVDELIEQSRLFQILFGIQLLGFLGLIFVAYKNSIPRKIQRKKLSNKTVTIVISLAVIFILLPYLVLLFE